jgi:hypothetical protein
MTVRLGAPSSRAWFTAALCAAATLVACASSAGAPSNVPTSGVTAAPPAALRTPRAAVTEESVAGGDPNATPRVISAMPAVSPRPGTTPRIDPTAIAAPQPALGRLRLIVDTDASALGIQPSRDVNPGDTFRVAVVLAGAPPFDGVGGGVASFNLELDYDRTKIVAPTIVGGPTTQRNPRLDVDALGGDAAGWGCEPASEGDLDDAGGTNGDGNPATGQAFLSCFMTGPSRASGDLVLATVTFLAVAPGDSALSLSHVAVADSAGVEFAHCPGGDAAPAVPCEDGSVTVR